MAGNRRDMMAAIRAVLSDKDLAREMSANGRQTILNRHTCAHRVDQLLDIYGQLHDAPWRVPAPRAVKEMIS
jgi:spore maturation protein CgeB